MKISLDIECTPAEARSFFGLPDIEAMQQRLLQKLEAQLDTGLGRVDMQKFSESAMKGLLTGAGAGLDRWQELFSAMLAGGGQSDKG